jgi:glutaminyl-peptide cyclotransferase
MDLREKGRGRGRGRALAGLVGVVVLTGASCSEGGADQGAADGAGGLDRIPAAERVAPEFDADSAFALLERQVAFGPRVPGSAGHAAQLEWMTSYLRERADTVILQPFEHTGPEGETLPLTNVFARFRMDLGDRVLLVAHWDTRPTADYETDPELQARPIPGANDGASGVAVLLQLADVLSSHSPPIGVDLLLADGEDYATSHMYLGATWFAEHKPRGYEPLYGVVVDMVADEMPRYPQEGYSRQYAPEVLERVWRMAERLGYQAHFPRSPGIAISDDHVPLNEAGIRTIDIIDFDYPYWHTLADDLSHVSPEGLGVVGTVLAELIYRGG